MRRQALIVGAGIGGLAAGRAFREAGFAVRILERVPRLEALGAGISLWPNAVRALQGLGLAEIPLAEAATETGIRRWDGKLLASIDSATIARRYGAPLLLLHRATLQRALLADGIEDLVTPDTVVTRVGEEKGQAFAETEAGETLWADVLVGADGIGSTVRAALRGEDPPRHSGLLAYRAVIDRPREEIDAGEYWGPGGVFGLVPIDGNRLYWYATRRTTGDEPAEDDPIQALLKRYREWAPGLREVIASTPPEAVLRHDLCDRKPTGRWVHGRVALLGDAAHPMLPFLGQGACQAIEDAFALRQVFSGGAAATDALLVYEKQRRQRAARVVRGSRKLAPLIHLRSAPVRAVRDQILTRTPESFRLRQLDPAVGMQR